LLFDKKWARDAFLGYLFKKSTVEGGIESFKNNERLISQLILDNINDHDTLEKILICLANVNDIEDRRNVEGKDLNGIIAYVLIVASQLKKLETVTEALQKALKELSDPDLENRVNAIITITKSRYKLPGASNLGTLKNYELKTFNEDLSIMKKDYLLYLEPLNYVSIGRRIFKEDGVILSESGRSLGIGINKENIIAIDHLGKIRIKEEKEQDKDKDKLLSLLPSPSPPTEDAIKKKQDYSVSLERDNGMHPIIKDGLQLSVNDLLIVAKNYRAKDLFDRWKTVEWPQKAILADMLPHVHIFRVRIRKSSIIDKK
jgi:hypothetical protein